MKAIVLRRHLLTDIPSASGMEISGSNLYLIGDDSPWLYVLDSSLLQQTGQIQLFETITRGMTRIPKALKPDLECLTLLKINGQEQLAAFGSGSSPNRAKGYTIALTGNQASVREHSLLELYKVLQADEKLLGGELLNLEAAATTSEQLLLLQRAARSGPNLLLSFGLAEFTAYLTGARKTLPAYQAIPFLLPKLEGVSARFSGAVVYDQWLFFTASVENTDDAILDGEILGSYIGWVALSALKPGKRALQPTITLVRDQDGQPYKGKIESLVIRNSAGHSSYQVLAITDNDMGQSELLEISLSLEGTTH